ncbi:hypothetical protein Q5H91_11945 [Sphingomonas sp. KR1UV-12]|uniref:Uncharacterized protein n=1 Tax=Sphingomonas aurea TaxID=3063994 RepID=A0ABT9EMA7_9SPHN|nr:hypothetical protein [Sphingomonas sp. KR1UV-12]MDP1027928.1 hypothetical protein [Sphingomonas sp. KR1UV-12]
MAGVIGATSGKFVLAGALLLLKGGVDGQPARIAIAPGAPTSAVGTGVDAHGGDERTIHLRAESFRARIAAVEPQPAADAQLRIGQDVLAAHPIAIDFARRTLELLLPGEARAFERDATPIAVGHAADGSLSVEITQAGQPPQRALLDLGSASGITASRLAPDASVTVGGVALPGADVADGPRPVVGLYAFRRSRVVFDLGHDRIWVRR